MRIQIKYTTKFKTYVDDFLIYRCGMFSNHAIVMHLRNYVLFVNILGLKSRPKDIARIYRKPLWHHLLIHYDEIQEDACFYSRKTLFIFFLDYNYFLDSIFFKNKRLPIAVSAVIDFEIIISYPAFPLRTASPLLLLSAPIKEVPFYNWTEKKITKIHNEYYMKSFRTNLKALASQQHMEFLDHSINILDSLVEEHIFHKKSSQEKISYENAFVINNKEYYLHKSQWDTIIGKLALGHVKLNINGIWKEQENLKNLLKGILIDMIPVNADVPYISSKVLNDKSFFTPLSIQNIGLLDGKLFIDKATYHFIQKIFHLLYERDSYASFYSINNEEFKGPYVNTVDILKQKLYSTIDACSRAHRANYNQTYSSGDDVRLPYTTLAKNLGETIINQIELFFLDFKSFLDEKNNPIILDWFSDETVANPKLALSKSLNIKIFTDLGFQLKEVKFIVRHLCLVYYVTFYGIRDNFKKKPQIFELLRKNVAPHIEKLQAYVESHKIKIGTVMINIMIRVGLIKHHALMDITEVKRKKRSTKEQLGKASFQKMRVIVLSDEVANGFIQHDYLARPYLTESNIKKRLVKAGSNNSIDVALSEYAAQVDVRIRENAFTKAEIKNGVVFGDDPYLVIDQEALLRLITIFAKACEDFDELDIARIYRRTGELEYQRFAERQRLSPDIDDNVYFKAVASIYNIDTEVLQKLRSKCPINYGVVIHIKYYMKRLSIMDCTQIRSYIDNQPLSNTDKKIYHKILDKIEGTKWSLKGLINDAVIYSCFKQFRIPTFIDTRGRVYSRATNLNIQGPTIIKTIVKMKQYPIIETSNNVQFHLTMKIVKDYVTKLELSPSEIEIWLHKYGFDNPKNFKRDCQKKRNQKVRILQLEKYLNHQNQKQRYSVIEHLVKTLQDVPENQHDIYLEQILPIIKNKKRLLIVYDIIRALMRTTQDHHKTNLVHRDYPFELDAVASGIQMTALTLGCSALAEWCGLIYRKGKDLYTTAGVQFETSLNDVKNIRIPKESDKNKLKYTIPQEVHWFIVPLVGNRKLTDNQCIKIFEEHRKLIFDLLTGYPEILSVLVSRDIWKNPIMTYAYNATTDGRVTALAQIIYEKIYNVISYKYILILAQLVESHFRHITQPTLISSAKKIKHISKLVATNANPSNKKATQRFCVIETPFLIHTIQPPLEYIHRTATTSQKGTKRGHQVDLKMKQYDSNGFIKINHRKVNLLLGPNLMHCNDAEIVHTIFKIFRHLNYELAENDLPHRFLVLTTHDNFASPDNHLLKGFIELAYRILKKKDPISKLKDNESYEEILKIIDPKYVFPKNKKKNKLSPYYEPTIKNSKPLELNNMGTFVK